MKSPGRIALSVIAAALFVARVGCEQVPPQGESPRPSVVAELRALGTVRVDEGRPGRPVTDVFLSGRRITDATMELVSRCTELRDLVLSDTRVTDKGMRTIGKLAQLRSLHLDGVQITDDGLSALASMKSLEMLVLSDTRVTNRGLERLRGLANLKSLTLFDGVDDKTLEILQALTQLHEIGFFDATKVSESAIEQMRQAIPGVQIYQPKSGTSRPLRAAELERRRIRRQGFTGRLRLAGKCLFQPGRSK